MSAATLSSCPSSADVFDPAPADAQHVSPTYVSTQLQGSIGIEFLLAGPDQRIADALHFKLGLQR
jgi:hypothetical protein